jgi:protein gp37
MRGDKGKYWDMGWQLIDGCTKVSEGCLNCWEETFAQRFYQKELQAGCFDFNGTIFLHNERLRLIGGKPKLISIWNDLFHKEVPFDFITKTFDIMSMWKWPNKKTMREGDESKLVDPGHVYLVPTKRPERIDDWLSWVGENWPGDSAFNVAMEAIGTMPDNIFIGVTIETWEHWDRAITLSKIPAAKRYWSIEPLLGEFPKQLPPEKTDWMIIGAESGANRRECKLEWLDTFLEYADLYNIPVFVKQLHIDGKLVKDITKFPKHLQRREFPK